MKALVIAVEIGAVAGTILAGWLLGVQAAAVVAVYGCIAWAVVFAIWYYLIR